MENKVILKPELLCPAGDKESFYAAISCGADAVYLGLDAFNARMRADNFSAHNIREFIEYAHFYGVRVYITVNTLLQNKDFTRLFEMVKAAVSAKADAFIVQDLGVCAALSQCFENIVIHLSTQAGVHNLYGARAAEAMGVRRVVLSRETKLEDIKAIRAGTGLEIEFFVQGALCVSFSGNCYMSEEECGDSGNQGICRQLCRLPYSAKGCGTDRSGYLLSAKDLCLIGSLKELAEAGVSSFKIEGRMKRAGYVAETTRIYRGAIDSIFCGKDSLTGNASYNPCDKVFDFEGAEGSLKRLFNRGGYSKRAYLDNVPDIITKTASNHVGAEIGRVISVKPFKNIFEVEIGSSHKLNTGDGLKFTEKGEERASAGVGNVVELGGGKYVFYTKTKLMRGWTVRLITDAEAEKRACGTKLLRPIDIDAVFRVGECPELRASFDGFKEISVKGVEVLESARTSVTDEGQIREQLNKVSQFGFEAREVRVDTDGIFIAKSRLNALRRELAIKCRQSIIRYTDDKVTTTVNDKKIRNLLQEIERSERERHESKARLVFIGAAEEKPIAFNEADVAVIFPEYYRKQEINDLLERAKLAGAKRFALYLPNFATGRDLEILDGLLAEFKEINAVVAENIYALEYERKGYRLFAGPMFNALNFLSRKTTQPAEFIGYRRPLMTLIHCPYTTLTGKGCGDCAYRPPLNYSRGNRKYEIKRVKIKSCRFYLYSVR